MFEIDAETLKTMGAEITTREIRQQPELWEDTLKIYDDNAEAIAAFLQRAEALGRRRAHPRRLHRRGYLCLCRRHLHPLPASSAGTAPSSASAPSPRPTSCAPLSTTCVPRIPPCWSPLPAAATAPSPCGGRARGAGREQHPVPQHYLRPRGQARPAVQGRRPEPHHPHPRRQRPGLCHDRQLLLHGAHGHHDL